MSRRLSPRPSTRRAGMTLLEIVVAAAIVSFLALVIMSATVPLSTHSSETAIAQDMDRTAAAVMAELRRTLRQTGYLDSSTEKFGQSAVNDGLLATTRNQITFQTRTGPSTTDWGLAITYSRVGAGVYSGVPGTITRFILTRTQNGFTTTVAEDVEDVTFAVPADDRFVHIELKLARPNPNWRGATSPPEPIRRTYREDVEMMNRPTS